MNKYQLMAEKIIVTFAEAAVAFLIVIPSPTFGKTVFAGAIGAGLSAVYNFLRESNPTIVVPTVATPVATPVVTVTPEVTPAPISPDPTLPAAA